MFVSDFKLFCTSWHRKYGRKWRIILTDKRSIESPCCRTNMAFQEFQLSSSVFLFCFHFFTRFFYYPITSQIKLFSNFFEKLTQFISKIKLAPIRKFDIKKLHISDYWPWCEKILAAYLYNQGNLIKVRELDNYGKFREFCKIIE